VIIDFRSPMVMVVLLAATAAHHEAHRPHPSIR
jgi:hypothetical protein